MSPLARRRVDELHVTTDPLVSESMPHGPHPVTSESCLFFNGSIRNYWLCTLSQCRTYTSTYPPDDSHDED